MAKHSPHILVVDSNTATLKYIEFTLTGIGYKSTLARNGLEAIEKTKNQHFDLIISDLYLPLMSGNDLVRQIRQTPEYKLTPFIFLSDNKEEETWIQNLNDGADDFITKPFKQEVFISKIKAHIKKTRLRKEIIDYSRKNNLNFDKGNIIYCTPKDNKFKLSLQYIKTPVKIIQSDKDLFSYLKKENVWRIIIDDNATWAISILDKISKTTEQLIPIDILISDSKDTDKINYLLTNHIDSFLYKQLDERLIIHQINSSVQQELNLKNKYFNALNTAAKQSPVRFENQYNEDIQDFNIQVIHQAYNKLAGGDFYETYDVDNQKKIIVIGDVMGKKWNAWFFVPAYIAYIRSTINFFMNREEFDFIKSPGKFLEIINQSIFKDLKISEVFTTLSIISVCSQTSQISIASAGALQPVFYNAKENKLAQLNIVGTLLGVIPDAHYLSLIQDFNQGDKLLLYTDGYIEAVNDRTGNMIGDDVFLDSIRHVISKNSILLTDIETQLIHTLNISKFDDDRTLFLVQKN
ncbi:fused response regulator/phosphatase [Ancylomarina salipaludis]|uniref:Fused response regulator/phosphatase n=1 Tax=Ancylomarina salipaludis TaxID=2501299 RepID=A0A4Q1JKW8_9BACT|nr:fused response regulator/phosphatase [Ancylomarina salipaludis]RXQ91572.1 fused response regulator/phosphatase [Ancylomarina salipaludis]